MGVGTKAMGDSKCYDSLQAGKLHDCTCIANCYLHLRAQNKKKKNTVHVFERLLILFVTCGLINFLCLPFVKFLDSTSKFNLSYKTGTYILMESKKLGLLKLVTVDP